jgi:hypothetical protein
MFLKTVAKYGHTARYRQCSYLCKAGWLVSYRLEGLESGTKYNIFVSAKTMHYESDKSNIIVVATTGNHGNEGEGGYCKMESIFGGFECISPKQLLLECRIEVNVQLVLQGPAYI